MEQVLEMFPSRLREELRALIHRGREKPEEIRLRRGWPVQVVYSDGVRSLSGQVTGEEMEQTLRLASRESVHTVLPQLRQGFLPLPGGHRLGVCGTVCLRDGAIHHIEPVFALNLRLARAVQGIGQNILPALCSGGRFTSTLILAPPGAGKTTLLRDVIRCLSDGIGCPPHRVGLAAERGEVAALYRGIAQLDVGKNTDVMDGCPKDRGLVMLLRGMNPQILAADEITAAEDVRAMIQTSGCGVQLLCTAHGAGKADLTRRPLYRELMCAGVFQNLLTIRVEKGQRRYEVEGLE